MLMKALLRLLFFTAPVLSSSYYNNEYFPYILNREIENSWTNEVKVNNFVKKSFSCEQIYR